MNDCDWSPQSTNVDEFVERRELRFANLYKGGHANGENRLGSDSDSEAQSTTTMNARLLAKVLVAVCISHTCLFVMVMADSEEMDLGRVLLMIKYLSAERTQRCGRSLLETIRLTCEFYDRYLAKVPDFATYLRYLSDLEREKYGEDVLAANFGIVERCCKQSCSYITIVDYCLPREMDMDNKRSV